MRGADGHRHLVPLVISQAVREHLSVGLLAFGTVVETHLAALATALQLQKPAGEINSPSSNSHTMTASLVISIPFIVQYVLLHLSVSTGSKS